HSLRADRSSMVIGGSESRENPLDSRGIPGAQPVEEIGLDQSVQDVSTLCRRKSRRLKTPAEMTQERQRLRVLRPDEILDLLAHSPCQGGAAAAGRNGDTEITASQYRRDDEAALVRSIDDVE